MANEFHLALKNKLDTFAQEVYTLTGRFPKEELQVQGIATQLRQSALAAALKYIEAFGKKRDQGYRTCIESAVNSIHEAKYLLDFAERQGLTTKADAFNVSQKSGEIGAMFWGILKRMNSSKNGEKATGKDASSKESSMPTYHVEPQAQLA